LSHLKRVKVLSNQLEVGMFVSDIDRDWGDTNFLLQGFTLEDQEDIESVKSQCEYVYVDFPSEDLYKRFRAKATVSTTLKDKFNRELGNSVQAEIKPAAKDYKKSRNLMKGVLERVMLGEDLSLLQSKNR